MTNQPDTPTTHHPIPDQIPETIARRWLAPILTPFGTEYDELAKITLRPGWVKITYRDGATMITRRIPIRTLPHRTVTLDLELARDYAQTDPDNAPGQWIYADTRPDDGDTP